MKKIIELNKKEKFVVAGGGLCKCSNPTKDSTIVSIAFFRTT